MGLRRWLLQTLAQSSASSPSGLDLLSGAAGQMVLPDLAGIDLAGAVRPWSVARLESITREAAVHPSPATLQAARQARHCLSVFWLAAPSDQLELLYSSAIGALQRLQLEGPLVRQELARDEQRWRDQLQQQLADPTQKPRQFNLLLALMPYTQPGQLSVEAPHTTLPDWLLTDYATYCAPDLQAQLQEPVGLLEAAREDGIEASEALEPLASQRGEEAMALFRDEQALTQMTALINRYSLNPEDQEVLEELSGLRCIVAQLWLDIEPAQAQSLYDTPVGLVTRSLITANFGSELVDAQDQRIRTALTNPDSPEGLIAMLLFYPAGAVSVGDNASLPDWLAKELDTLQ